MNVGPDFNNLPVNKISNPFPNKPWFLYVCLQHKSYENTVRKGEIANEEQFLLFPQCFLTACRTLCHFHQIQNCCLQTLSVWKSKVCCMGNG